MCDNLMSFKVRKGQGDFLPTHRYWNKQNKKYFIALGSNNIQLYQCLTAGDLYTITLPPPASFSFHIPIFPPETHYILQCAGKQ